MMIKKIVSKKELLFGILFCTCLFLLAYVFAGTTSILGIPTTVHNYSGTVVLNCSSGIENALNASFYYNETGGDVDLTNTFGTGYNHTGMPNASYINLSVNTALFNDSSTYNITCILSNATGTRVFASVRNVTFDNSAPRVTGISVDSATTNLYFNGSVNLTINVTINDSIWQDQSNRIDLLMGIDSVYFNISHDNGTLLKTGNFVITSNGSDPANGTTYYNSTFDISNVTTFADGKYNLTIYANDSERNNLNNSEFIQLIIDNTAPVVTHSCTPSSVTVGQLVTCVCSGEDPVAGINYTYDGTTTSSTATVVTTLTPDTAGTYTRTCYVKDRVGHLTTTTATYIVENSPSAGSSTSSSGPSSSPSTTSNKILNEISPGEPMTISDFNQETSINQIQIEVKEKAQNVQVTVNKYDSKPSDLSSSKEGAYNYLQIQTQNLAEKLEKATMRIQVEKIWVSEQELLKEDVELFRYNEDTGDWNSLGLSYSSEDDDYYYYEVVLEGFSYFAIAPKQALTIVDSEETEQPSQEEISSDVPLWAWIILGVALVLGIVLGIVYYFKIKKPSKK